MNDEITKEGTRLSKKVALVSKFSRNEAEKLINSGKVSVNGTVVRSATQFVGEEDVVKIEGEKLAKPLSEIKILAMHKPKGFVVTRNDEKGRKTIYSLIPPQFSNYIYIGRLDMNSEGLLLLTNSGDLAHEMELPANGFEREYEVRVFGFLDEKKFDRMQKGVTIDGMHYKVKSVSIKKRKNDDSKNTWLTIILETGKNREIRKLMEFFNLSVSRLIRVKYANVALSALPLASYMELPKAKVLKVLKEVEKQCGKKFS